MADEGKAPDAPDEEKKSGGMMKLMMMGMGMFIIVLAAQTVAPLITTKLGIAPPPVIVQQDGEAGGDATDAEDAGTGPPIYWPLKPALIVNFAGGGESSFLQVELEVMAREQGVIDQVKEHTPALRNALLMLLASQDDTTVFTTEGKEALRQQALVELNTVLEPYVEAPGLEAVYFTSFVAQ